MERVPITETPGRQRGVAVRRNAYRRYYLRQKGGGDISDVNGKNIAKSKVQSPYMDQH